MLMIPEPMWMRSVIASAYAIHASLADRCEYSSRKWCSVDPDVLEARAIGRLDDVELGPEHVLLGLSRLATVVRVVHADEDTELHGLLLFRVLAYGCWLETDTTSPVM